MKFRLPSPDLEEFDETSKRSGDEDLATRLSKLVDALEHGAVALFSGEWGIGKSVFVRRWAHQLRKNNTAVIYIDAFEADYLESPFVALAGELANQLKASGTSDKTYQKFLSAASKVGKGVAATAARIGVRVATMGALDLADVEALADSRSSIADAIADDTEMAVETLIREHSDRKNEVSELRAALADLVEESGSDETTGRLVVIIDELDRCRPDFALELIELIKHFFSVPNIIFVLVCNSDQLEKSVAQRYGNNVNATEYLRKFYDFRIDYQLDHNDVDPVKVRAFVHHCHNNLMTGIPNSQEFVDFIVEFARTKKLSLRDIEDIYKNLVLALSVIDRRYKPTSLVGGLAILKVVHPQLFAKAKSGDLTYEEVEDALFTNADSERLNIGHISKIFRWHLDPEIDPNDIEWKGWSDSDWKYNLGRLNTIAYVSNSIIDRFEVPLSDNS